jgi:hypothetical protein
MPFTRNVFERNIMTYEEYFCDWLRNYITPLFAYLNLLGMYLLMLGIGLGALASWQRRRIDPKKSTQKPSL